MIQWWLICLLFLTTFYEGCQAAPKFPVILVPGDGGSQLEIRLNRTIVPHYYCQRQADWTNAWVNYKDMAPYVINCWAESMRLVYDILTRTTGNPHGVETRVLGWGDTNTIEWLDQVKLPKAAYFTKIVDALVQEGYVRGKSVRGAPYDFRRGPNEQTAFFEKFAILVEDTYRLNNNSRVVLVCHSMGCPLTKFMLKAQKQNWKDRYVKSLVALAGAWGGSVKALKAFSYGDNLGIPLTSSSVFRTEERTFPSMAFLAPSKRLWRPEEVLVETSKRNYTIENYERFFKDIGYLIGYEILQDVSPWMLDTTPPGVKIHCLHGQGQPTIERLVYKTDDFDAEPTQLFGDGDGTVNARSLKYCGQFKGRQKSTVELTPLNTDHMGILSDPVAINAVKEAALGV